MDKSKETPNAQNLINQTPRRLVRKNQKSQNPNVVIEDVKEAQKPQNPTVDMEEAKETQKSKDSKAIIEEVKEMQKSQNLNTSMEEAKEMQKPKDSNVIMDEIKKQQALTKITEALLNYLDSGTSRLEPIESRSDSKIEERKLSFKPMIIPKQSGIPSQNAKSLAKVDKFRFSQIQQSSSPSKSDFTPFTQFNSQYVNKAIPLTQSYNPFVPLSNQVTGSQINELSKKIQILESKIQLILNNSKSCNSNGPFNTINSNLINEIPNNPSGSFLNRNSNIINNILNNTSDGNSINRLFDSNLHYNIPRNFSGPFQTRNSKYTNNPNNYKYTAFHHDRKFSNRNKLSIILTVNAFYFNKLRNLLYRLNQYLEYDELSTNNDLTRIKLWLQSHYAYNTVKKYAHKWIIYRKKQPVKCSTAPGFQSSQSSSLINTTKDPLINPNNLPLTDWKIHECVGDGNCLFRAMANQIYGKQSVHPKVRREIINYMSSNRMHFEKYLNTEKTSFNDYINSLKALGTWGDNLEIDAASKLYQRQIIIYSHKKDEPFFIQQKTFYEESPGNNGVIRLLFGDGHYDAIVRKMQSSRVQQHSLQDESENFRIAQDSEIASLQTPMTTSMQQ